VQQVRVQIRGRVVTVDRLHHLRIGRAEPELHQLVDDRFSSPWRAFAEFGLFEADVAWLVNGFLLEEATCIGFVCIKLWIACF
jgi:hypothetical protein